MPCPPPKLSLVIHQMDRDLLHMIVKEMKMGMGMGMEVKSQELEVELGGNQKWRNTLITVRPHLHPLLYLISLIHHHRPPRISYRTFER